jgi:hypothetical protein
MDIYHSLLLLLLFLSCLGERGLSLTLFWYSVQINDIGGKIPKRGWEGGFEMKMDDWLVRLSYGSPWVYRRGYERLTCYVRDEV